VQNGSVIANSSIIEMITHGDIGLELRVAVGQFEVNWVCLDSMKIDMILHYFHVAVKYRTTPCDYENCPTFSLGSQINVMSYGV
jgi:hypothetical protein